MPKPITPLVGCDVFTVNEKKEVLLVKRSDSHLWALPGGFHDFGETPAGCAIRECLEETGYIIEIKGLLGVFSSNRYPYVHYQWKDNEITHILFLGSIVGGDEKLSEETIEIGWFSQASLPALFDGHAVRIATGFSFINNELKLPHFE